MTRSLIVAVAAAGLLLATPASAQSLLQKLLRIAGLTAAPSQLRNPSGAPVGDIWAADVTAGTRRALTEGGGYRSPVFSPDGSSLYALRDDVLVQLADGQVTMGVSIPGVLKLVGFDAAAPGELVVLLDGRDAVGTLLAVVTPHDRRIAPLAVDMNEAAERQMITYIRGDERVYQDARLFTRTETKAGAIRPIEWTEVYLQRGAAAAVNVSRCDGANCSQPAMSPDGARVAWVRTSSAQT